MPQYMDVLSDENYVIKEDLAHIALSPLPWNEFKDKIIMLTGGGGFLAAYLIKSILTANFFHNLNCRIICVVRRKASVELRLAAYLNTSNFSIIEHDISLPLPANFPKANIIIHAASQASPKYYGIDPVGTLSANTMGTLYLLNHAIKSKTERFMFFSSGEVYGSPVYPEQMVSETDYGKLDPMNVRSCYAESKRMGETMCVSWAHQYGLHTNVVRPFHTYGPGMALDDGRVFADFVSDVVGQRDIVLKSDGMALRPFCYVLDATIAFLTVLLRGAKAEAYNVGNPEAESTIRDLATTLASLFPERNLKTRFEVSLASNAYLKSPIIRSCPSIQKINGLGWKPTTGVEDGFRRTILSFEQNRESTRK
jgi:UDP-glucuronate decarboxylase